MFIFFFTYVCLFFYNIKKQVTKDETQEKVLFLMGCMVLFQIVDHVFKFLEHFLFLEFFLCMPYLFTAQANIEFLFAIVILHNLNMSSSFCMLSQYLGH